MPLLCRYKIVNNCLLEATGRPKMYRPVVLEVGPQATPKERLVLAAELLGEHGLAFLRAKGAIGFQLRDHHEGILNSIYVRYSWLASESWGRCGR
jgi:hypothetical protein